MGDAKMTSPSGSFTTYTAAAAYSEATKAAAAAAWRRSLRRWRPGCTPTIWPKFWRTTMLREVLYARDKREIAHLRLCRAMNDYEYAIRKAEFDEAARLEIEALNREYHIGTR